ncbi:predicted protein [Naegleria gruberi]|uniref:Fanconi-associated nuclease n=1 Tax=Naegleria gruberi TaxID=5762 RepID=D2VHM9_NAEGR|nr:uncharacterized protein NAEGRDRAFT_58243 [Naegleria gruberi]EFC43708.1 predicted protein [Naegleria gruberi]|eukprot:XP_002676452.1 predicted protein [Naegleria gruberi strain NEG-M]
MPPKTPTSSKHKKGANSITPSPKTPSSSKSQSGGSASSKKSSSSTPGTSSSLSSKKKSISPGVKSASILSFFQPSKGNNNSSSVTPKKRSISEVDSQGNTAEDALIILDDDDNLVGEMVNRTPSSSDGGKLFSSAIIDIDGGKDHDSHVVTILDNSPLTDLVKQDSQQRFGNLDSQGLNEEDSFDGVRSYYLFHFLEILDTVMKRDGHLFIDEEKQYISNFKNLCTASQRLYIRMFNRKQKYFTKTELDKYKKELEKTIDINEEDSEERKKNQVICCKSVKEALSHLGSVQLVDSLSIVDREQSSTEWNIDDLKSLLSEFTNKQLKAIIDKKNLSNIVKKEKSKKTTDSPKQDLIKTIITKPESLNSVGSDGKQQKKLTFLKKKEPTESKPLDDSAKDSDPTIMRPSDILKLIAKASTSSKEIESMYYRLGSYGKTIFKRIHHLYFLSQSADNATIMILEQKKIAIFPKYEIQEQKSLFSSREDFIKYEEAFDIANTWMDSIDVPDPTPNKQNGQDAQNSQDALLSTIEMRLDMIQKSNVDGIVEKFNNFAKDIASRLEQDTSILKKMYEESNSDFTMDYYLLRFRCGYIYGRLLWFCVKVLERNKNYELAIQYTKQIIESPFMIGKRGEFYNRLALDYEHLKTEESYKNALQSCKAGIFNETGSVFARSISLPPNKLYALEKRYFRICKKLEKINSKLYSSLSKESSVIDKFISTNVKPPKLVYIQGKTKKLENRKYREKKHHFISHKDNETIVSVEDFAMEHYEMKNCMQGAHSEGSLWAMMFMLVMWNIVFDSSIPYVFQNKYQSCPLDFMTDAFYIRRRDKFKKRLEEIEEKGAQYLKEQIKTCWNENYGVNAVCCNWRAFTEPTEEDGDEEMTMEIQDDDDSSSQTENKENEKLEALLAIAECFPIKVTTTILQTLAEDIKENRSGMPDLILWKIQQDGKHEHLLSEIKGPGDKLSEKQIIWIDLLTKAGCSIEVCHVKVKEDSSTSSTPVEQQPKKKRKCSSDSQIEFLDDDLWASIEEQSTQQEEDNTDDEDEEVSENDEIDLLEP